MYDSELPRDADLDELRPVEIAEHPGPLYIGWRDPDTGTVYPHRPIMRERIAVPVADDRPAREAEQRG
jgi:hypothetical protein